MTPSQGGINVQPGKQLPQTFVANAHAKAPTREVTIRYLLFTPTGYTTAGKKWPLMLFLHGIGECSSADLSRAKIHGPPHIVDARPDFPFVVVTPQLPPPGGYREGVSYTPQQILRFAEKAWDSEELVQLVDHVATAMNIDPERIYVTGLSMGGYGTWRLVAAYPDRFAAAVPICGGGEPEAMAQSLRRVPIWAFHGAKDPIVPLAAGQAMVDAVKHAGGDVKFTVYPNATHNSWTETYNNPAVYDWLLEHRLHAAKRR